MPNFLTKTYVGLLIARILFALFGTGYIHPDEHFQNGEITAGSNDTIFISAPRTDLRRD